VVGDAQFYASLYAIIRFIMHSVPPIFAPISLCVEGWVRRTTKAAELTEVSSYKILLLGRIAYLFTYTITG
jgi:hypothetical protein